MTLFSELREYIVFNLSMLLSPGYKSISRANKVFLFLPLFLSSVHNKLVKIMATPHTNGLYDSVGIGIHL